MVDLVLLGAFAGFARAGWQSGFVRRLAGLVFVVAAFVLAAYLRPIAGDIITGIFRDVPEQYAEMVGYSMSFSAILIALNLSSNVILSRVAVQGIARRTDQLLGVALGIAEGVLLLSALIVILHTYAEPRSAALPGMRSLGILETLRDAIETSTIGQLLENTTVPIVLLFLGPFLPTDIKSIVPTQIPGGLPFLPTGIPDLPTP